MPHHQPVFNSAVEMSPSGISLVRNADLTHKVAAVAVSTRDVSQASDREQDRRQAPSFCHDTEVSLRD